MKQFVIEYIGTKFERIFDMQQPQSPQNGSQRKNGAPVERTYIRPTTKKASGAAPKKSNNFQNVLLSLTVVFTVSLVVLIALLFSLKMKSDDLEATAMSLAAENSAAREELSALEAIATEVLPAEEPEPYAAYTDSTITLDGIRSEYAILIDVANNEVVAHKNGDEKMFPASMTKVMTLIVAYEHIEDLSDTFTFSYTITDPAYQAGASVAGFLSSETVPLIDIMYGIALPSGADATTAAAVYVAGSEEAFAELMNEKVEELGLENTHFVNASGLHAPDHYSTAHDIAKIFEYAMNIPELATILSTYQYTTTSTEQHPEGILLTSTMFSRMYGDEPEVAEVLAGKTGYTNEASNCLVSMAETPDGRRYILATGKAASIAGEGQYGAVYDAIEIYKNYIPSV
ncbi:MAG: D-alanyl-D-alanine carboxypeptidase [Clostridia bacterium]|nr:D-alanyl-D-alanine carboxypeptidase [Clostridia bacterium]